MSNLQDILTNNPGDELSDEELLLYLEGKLSPEAQHALEAKLVDSAFMNDAVEGLEAFSSKQHLNDYVLQLNKQLHQQLHTRKQQKEKRKIKDLPWLMIYVVIVLLLCILGYVVIRMIRA
ncbi:hypothetical protein [Deminuibacter soli]|uniref:Uncharacterized protein n=1 Tax=Deminuibacter soli TaxID=2291815 RepID=A0A3E1NIE3_9BACT|nr:hypothetical protein [Deminuibacter soli]RFM27703.1 hypothetical protein DXN05_13430 [Deminuibacter soli]